VALLAGLFMIQSENKKSIPVNQNDNLDAAQVVETMNLMAEVAKQELQSQQPDQAANPAAGIGDIKPQESIARVAALNGVMPETGSDDWCEVMMVKDADKWTQEEQSLFAKHCL
jgi:hypothetical protein